LAIHEDEYLQRRHVYEEHAYVLDFLPYGRSSEKSRHLAVPTIQIMGEQFFTLLEAELKIGATVLVHERIYIGRDRREKVDRILTRISYEQLTANAKAEIGPLISQLVKTQEKRFVDFFNNSQPVTPRMHSLELLPGIGKKSMWQIVNMREKKTFVSYKDTQERTGLSDIPKIISKRIIEELSTDAKYRLFTRAV
jgi:putative nucleotide binding protein